MPAMIDLTVKKLDGATNITYNVLSQSNGDGTFAKWRQDTGNSNPPAARPTFWYRAGDRNGRRYVEYIYMAPYFYTDTQTSQVVVSAKRVVFRNGQWDVPQDVPGTFVQEAIAQGVNLMAEGTVRSAANSQTSFV